MRRKKTGNKNAFVLKLFSRNSNYAVYFFSLFLNGKNVTFLNREKHCCRESGLTPRLTSDRPPPLQQA